MNPYQPVVTFWFDECTPEQWFKKDATFDNEIQRRFGDLCLSASRGELASWRETIEGRLGEIIILDQFSRNIWRDTPQAFAQDNMALVLAQEASRLPDYLALTPTKRKFVIMPFMHSESAKIHEDAITLFSQLNDEKTYEYELRHKEIIDKFGRFPHRNKILGRESTPEEIEFLQQPGSSF
ncbi:DUF924 family protein [Proteus myxofaciens]|uniref:Uncharacterized DUF924 family protein n=1 Tax=Proteus myxofaciens ATCC 19692 TaxID=1354337 RepID=A0A198GIG5_9GAMM|nr:DUF924 family protein [Proteus myxofaciens]OAT35991.1 uncharacterized DUF924 family protein [Proteus myxofaciens ATCC 19692]